MASVFSHRLLERAPQALDVAARLVRDAGFEPVVAGPLAKAKMFDVTIALALGWTRGEQGRANIARDVDP